MTAMEKNNKNLNVPHLRFPEFSGEWDNGTLQSVATLSKGTGISKDQLSEEGHPCILYGELYTKYRSEMIDTIISKTDIDPKKLVRSQANDVIIPCSGESAVDIATARCVKQSNILLGGDLNIMRLKGEHDGSFFAYQLNGRRKYDIAKVAQGVSVVHLYGEHLKGVKVNYPSAAEQKKISSLLALIDQRIETQKKIIEDLKKLKDAISFILFTSETCDKWELSNLATIVMGQSPSSQCYNTDNDGLPLIQGNLDITKGKLTPRLYSSEMTKKCHTGDVILTVRAPVGEVAIADFDACIGRGVCAIRPFNNNYSVLIYQFLQHYKPKWISLEQGSTFTSVSRNDIMSIKIGVPSIQAIEILNILDDKISIEDVILNNLNSQKNYLLAQMFI